MDAASARIMDKLWQGSLPADDPVEVLEGVGTGLFCDGCDAAPNEPEHDIEMPDERILRFHVACAGLWRALKQAMPKVVATSRA
jgi:hypothetical protein